MEFMLLFLERPDAPRFSNQVESYATALSQAGKLPSGVLIDRNADVTRVRVRDGDVVRSEQAGDGAEVLTGFWVVEAASRAEAIAIAQGHPHAQHGTIEVHLMLARQTFPDSGAGQPYLITFHMEPGLTDFQPKMQAMRRFGEELVADGKLLETAPLAFDTPPARVVARKGKILVTDGPFAETKEGVGGYSFIRAASRAEAISIAERFPHATWGPVEVRDALSFRPT